MLKEFYSKMHTSIKKYEIKELFKKNSKTISPLHSNKNCDAFEFFFYYFFLRCWIHAYSFISQCTVIYLFLGWVGEMIKNI